LQIGNELPDLVLTDLQMPDLDGLQLVTSITEKYPDVPVVLMTAHGSEVIAAQALASGAASYVPKTELAESLVETVMHILAMSESDARYKKLMRCAIKTDFEFNLDNDLQLVDPLVDMIQQIVSSQGLLDSTNRVRMGVALEHALQNAIVRGNLEIPRDQFPVINRVYVQQRNKEHPYCDRRVYFRAKITHDSVHFVVRDQGPGFDVSTVPAAGNPDSFRDGMGRGLVLIKTFMDEVVFNATGNEVHMTKYRNDVPKKPR
jgi:CheY-like chemotaxis protein